MENKNLLLSLPKKDKEEFYKLCKTLELKPMRVILILMGKFVDGTIDAMPVIQAFKDYKEGDISNKTIMLLKNRITGKQAYKIHMERLDVKL